MPLIPLTSWIIHSQLELRGWSCLHGTTAFSVIHLLSYARDILIVVYCSLPDRMLFLCCRDYSRQQCWEIKSIKGMWEPFSRPTVRNIFRFTTKLHDNMTVLPRCQKQDNWSDTCGVSLALGALKIPAALHKESFFLAWSRQSGWNCKISGITWKEY